MKISNRHVNEKDVIKWMAHKMLNSGFGEGDLHRLYAKAKTATASAKKVVRVRRKT